MTQGSQVISFQYDAAGRQTTQTLGNGVVTEYAYDAASQLKSITHKKAGTVISQMLYEYDDAGRRISQTGSTQVYQLPTPTTSVAVYNDHNQLISWNGQTYAYDNNGNLTNDGTRTYTWNNRNELASLTYSGGAGTFVYDAFGRRNSKTISGTQTGCLFDGMNFIQELSGTTPKANLLTGGIDQVFSRTTTGDALTSHYLTDALGSTVALTNSAGTPISVYQYAPYGYTQASGNTTNTQTYTGREDDGTGLLYYRARYYLPNCGRFISEDPIGIAGGMNTYAYVGGDPVSFRDPLGLRPGCSGPETQFTVGIGGLAGFSPSPTIVFPSWFLAGSTSIGFTSNGALLLQFQGTASGGIGAYAGVGVQGGMSRSTGPSSPGWTDSLSAQADINVGWGPSIGGSLQVNGEGKGIQTGLPGAGRLGIGIGAQASLGVTQTTTYTTPNWFGSCQ
jgi:RHS repeat-associated protein